MNNKKNKSRPEIHSNRILILFYFSIVIIYLVRLFFVCFYSELKILLNNIDIIYLKLTFWGLFSIFFLILLLMFVDLTYNERVHFPFLIYLVFYGFLFIILFALFFTNPWFWFVRDLIIFLNNIFLPVVFLDLYIRIIFYNRMENVEI